MDRVELRELRRQEHGGVGRQRADLRRADFARGANFPATNICWYLELMENRAERYHSQTDVTPDQVLLAIQAGVLAAGPAPAAGGSQHSQWLERVGGLAREVLTDLAPVIQDELRRIVKVIPVTGVLDIPARQNNEHRINYTITTGGRYPDTLWTEFFKQPEELSKERARLEALVGKRVRLVKVTERDLDDDGGPVMVDGRESQRSYAQGGVIELADGILAEPGAWMTEREAKREIWQACRAAHRNEIVARDQASQQYEALPRSKDGIRRADVEAARNLGVQALRASAAA